MGGNNSTLNCYADKACKTFIDTAASNAACKTLKGVAVINNGPGQTCKAIQLDQENMTLAVDDLEEAAGDAVDGVLAAFEDELEDIDAQFETSNSAGIDIDEGAPLSS
eukprot:tig00020572_g11564.t1